MSRYFLIVRFSLNYEIHHFRTDCAVLVTMSKKIDIHVHDGLLDKENLTTAQKSNNLIQINVLPQEKEPQANVKVEPLLLIWLVQMK